MKIIFLIFSISLYIYGSDSSQKEIKIHDALATSLFSANKINVYSDSQELKNNILKYSNKLRLSDENDAEYIIKDTNIESTNNEALVLVTSYTLLKQQTDAIGAFYWKKGRPTIIFIRERLEKKGIFLPQSLHKYYENEKCLYELCF